MPSYKKELISPFNIRKKNYEKKEKTSFRGLLVDPIPTSWRQYHRNCTEDSKEN